MVTKVYAGHSILSVACELGINSGQLYQWVRKYRLNGFDGLKLKQKGRPSKLDNMPRTNDDVKQTKQERGELKLLRRRNEYLEAENAYLKK